MTVLSQVAKVAIVIEPLGTPREAFGIFNTSTNPLWSPVLKLQNQKATNVDSRSVAELCVGAVTGC